MTTIAEEEPFVSVVLDGCRQKVCAYCFRRVGSIRAPGIALKRCAKCSYLFYCSKECQQNDWLIHKIECRLIRKRPDWPNPRMPDEQIRLMYRLIIRIRYDDGLSAQAFNGNTFDDLRDAYQEITSDSRYRNLVRKLNVVYDSFEEIGLPLLYATQEMIVLFGKVLINGTYISYETFSVGYGLYLGLSAHRHSCCPDVHIVSHGRMKYVMSVLSNVTYSTELTVSYVEEDLDTKERQRILRTAYYFSCECEMCNDRGRDAEWRSVRCSSCANGTCPLYEDSRSAVCADCGNVSNISVEEGMEANTRCCRFFNADRVNTPTSLFSALQVYDSVSRILSHRNFNLARLSKDIVGLAIAVRNKEIMEKFATKFHDTYRYFLYDGSQNLAIAHVYAVANLIMLKPRAQINHIVTGILGMSSMEDLRRMWTAAFGEDLRGDRAAPLFGPFSTVIMAKAREFAAILGPEGRNSGQV